MKVFIRSTLCLVIALGVMAFLPTAASGHTLDDSQEVEVKNTYKQYAVKSKSAPPTNATCSKIVITPEQIGRACFEAHGDKFWVNDDEKDGRHIEMKGVMSNTQDGFTCVGSGSLSMGWQVCETFSNEIDENQKLWFAADLFDGDKKIASGPHKIVET